MPSIQDNKHIAEYKYSTREAYFNFYSDFSIQQLKEMIKNNQCFVNKSSSFKMQEDIIKIIIEEKTSK